jgi:hypothetical protein
MDVGTRVRLIDGERSGCPRKPGVLGMVVGRTPWDTLMVVLDDEPVFIDEERRRSGLMLGLDGALIRVGDPMPWALMEEEVEVV